MKSLRLAAFAAALTLAAACSSTPTEPASVGAPSFDAGPGTTGSGNVMTDSTGTPERGGGMLGSGN